MRSLDKLRLRFRSLFRPNRVEQELDAELQFHLEQLIEENVAAGMHPDQERFAAQRSIGASLNSKRNAATRAERAIG